MTANYMRKLTITGKDQCKTKIKYAMIMKLTIAYLFNRSFIKNPSGTKLLH